MKKLILAATLSLGVVIAATPAYADGDVVCNAGPKDQWQSMAALKKAAWKQGWKINKVQVEGDCYEVYAITEEGQAIEAFFHPVTLKKLVVFRRGQEIFHAKGFTG